MAQALACNVPAADLRQGTLKPDMCNTTSPIAAPKRQLPHLDCLHCRCCVGVSWSPALRFDAQGVRAGPATCRTRIVYTDSDDPICRQV